MNDQNFQTIYHQLTHAFNPGEESEPDPAIKSVNDKLTAKIDNLLNTNARVQLLQAIREKEIEIERQGEVGTVDEEDKKPVAFDLLPEWPLEASEDESKAYKEAYERLQRARERCKAAGEALVSGRLLVDRLAEIDVDGLKKATSSRGLKRDAHEHLALLSGLLEADRKGVTRAVKMRQKSATKRKDEREEKEKVENTSSSHSDVHTYVMNHFSKRRKHV